MTSDRTCPICGRPLLETPDDLDTHRDCMITQTGYLLTLLAARVDRLEETVTAAAEAIEAVNTFVIALGRRAGLRPSGPKQDLTN